MKTKFYISIVVSVSIICSCGTDNSENKDSKESITQISKSSDATSNTNTNIKAEEKLPADQLRIGDQIWMSTNLNVDKFRNGDPITEAKTAQEWEKAGKDKKPAWCYYENNPANGEKYGRLYNWYAVNDPRGIAPEGFHIPKQSEWKKLITTLGGKNVAGQKMKAKSGWKDNGNGSNESGFNSVPGGNRMYDGAFKKIGIYSGWWSATGYGNRLAGLFRLTSENGKIFERDDSQRERGFAVRCVKD